MPLTCSSCQLNAITTIAPTPFWPSVIHHIDGHQSDETH